MKIEIEFTEEEFQQLRPYYKLLWAIFKFKEPYKKKHKSPALKRWREKARRAARLNSKQFHGIGRPPEGKCNKKRPTE